MKKEIIRKIWQMPWDYPESIIITCGILVVGFLLQLTIGSFNFYLLAAPVNLWIGVVLIILCLASLRIRRSPFVKWLSGVPLSVCLILALLVLSLIMGLTPQVPSNENPTSIFSRLGFDNMTHSWAFIFIYFTTLLSLGCLIARRLYSFRWKDYGFYLNHIGLWFVLFASGLGYADMERYVMHIREGEIEWRVYDDYNNVKELPIAIKLHDFDMEEYPPKLTVIDRQSGEPQPVNNPDYYQIDIQSPQGRLNGWNIKVEEYIHQAVRNSDSSYREVPMPGATPAVKIQAVNSEGKEISGWVCGGNQAQLYMTLPLNEQHCIVMTATEPKSFKSDIEVYTPDGTTKKGIVEVNHPMQTGHWSIYQYGYDNKAGRLSSYSSMELVYDPWITPVYIGFLLIALGAICMILNGKKTLRKEKEDITTLETENI
ncbi:cytochrome c biogenesis protein ResB [Porphyromonadaceae bacterium OttesenSCG-928-L07]|nr:cytochrome c biogenesis protein ResB [Porphyromonadaceae bacterium OttesenSCG-928-L07]MDL2251895.1 cytochrome c biogenesis protein ResB [Odoribacter sp. OttesenSCG-928-J03]MDL2283376.1 cytochrome c biogenesis protein ResB [Odoribacter sp. OttesenSCG-928-G04]